MKTRTVGRSRFSRKAARVAAAALLLSACKGGTRHGSLGKPVTDGAPSMAAGARGTATRRAGLPPSAEFQAELGRRRTAWVEKPLSQGDNRMTPERVRRAEMSRFELTSLAQEAAMIDMGLAETEKAALRKTLTDFRDAILLRIEHPSQAKDTSAVTLDELARRIGEHDKDPSAPISLYSKRMRETLGEADHAEFARLEGEERAKLIAARRAFRNRTANTPAAVSQP